MILPLTQQIKTRGGWAEWFGVKKQHLLDTHRKNGSGVFEVSCCVGDQWCGSDGGRLTSRLFVYSSFSDFLF